MSRKPQRLPADWTPTGLTAEQVNEIRMVIDDRLADYVPLLRYIPVERITFFFAACVASGVVGAVVTAVVKNM